VPNRWGRGGDEAKESREGFFPKAGVERKETVLCVPLRHAREERGTADEIRDGRFERVWSRVNRTERDD
jgi:hypothetical protein